MTTDSSTFSFVLSCVFDILVFQFINEMKNCLKVFFNITAHSSFTFLGINLSKLYFQKYLVRITSINCKSYRAIGQFKFHLDIISLPFPVKLNDSWNVSKNHWNLNPIYFWLSYLICSYIFSYV